MWRAYNWQAWGALLTVVTFLFWVTVWHKFEKPPLDFANGTYASACCSPIMISNGKLIYRGQEYGLDLEHMKFGLTGFLKGSLSDGTKMSSRPTMLSFSGQKSRLRFDVLLNGKEQTFVRTGTENARLH